MVRTRSRGKRPAKVRITKKIKKFVNEPIEGKPVEAVGGIGKVYGKRLRERGITTAAQLLEKRNALVEMGEEYDRTFNKMLHEEIMASRMNINWVLRCLLIWCNKHCGPKGEGMKVPFALPYVHPQAPTCKSQAIYTPTSTMHHPVQQNW